jgi:uncharacterized protein
MEMNKSIIKNKIKELLFNKPEISFAYIFGSFIQKEHYHDIDIAVYLTEKFNKNDLKKFPYGYESLITGSIMELLHTDKVDLVLMNNASILLTNRIINTGELLFDKDKFKRVAFENYNRKLFIDTENFRKIRTHYLLKKINRYA